MLLALDGKSGLVRPLPERALDFALSGALLLELAFMKKIDADVENIHLANLKGISDPTLKDAVAALPRGRMDFPIETALERLATKGAKWKRRVLASLIKKGIVERRRLRVFFFIRRRAFPVVDMPKVESLRARIRKIVADEGEIPSPREVVLVALMNACALGSTVFTEDELDTYRERIDSISRMDLIALSITRRIADIQNAITAAMAVSGI